MASWPDEREKRRLEECAVRNREEIRPHLRCEKCHGHGRVLEGEYPFCDHCHGSGVEPQVPVGRPVIPPPISHHTSMAARYFRGMRVNQRR